MKHLSKSISLSVLALFIVTIFSQSAFAQNERIVLESNPLKVKLGEEVQLKATYFDSTGAATSEAVFFFPRGRSARRALTISNTGLLVAETPGKYQIIAQKNRSDNYGRFRATFTVDVEFPPIAEVKMDGIPKNIYASSTTDLRFEVTDKAGLTRENPDLTYTSSNEDVLRFQYGKLIAIKPGKFTITAEIEGVKAEYKGEVKANPATEIAIGNTETLIRTGDVVNFDAVVKDRRNRDVTDAPITYGFIAQPDDTYGQAAEGQISQEGKFVANKPGLFTLTARSGNAYAEQIIRVEQRNVAKDVEVVGHGAVLDVHTSDLWVWEGVDGRDYAVTGTWGASGDTYFWDVTDPSNIVAIDTVRIDARTVNDVKVSEDGRVAVLTREGASDRKNGIVILDVTNPRDVKIHSEYTEGLTGGVHNSFIYENHVYAVNNGTRYDIINIEDPKNPRTVGRFELDTKGHSIHDVWIEDGIAYSSNWSDGIVAVDIGSNVSTDFPATGGSPENPVYLGSYKYPSGWNHAAFPFKSKSTGDFYIIGGDEAFPYGLNFNGPNKAAGWMHFIKLNSWGESEEVARYEVPEAGTHNMWVLDDVLFAAYYNGGLRIVDISGELMGNLYDQGREIAIFQPSSPDSFIPNSPFTWGPQPYKGHIFISDWNSGLWAIKLNDRPVSGTN